MSRDQYDARPPVFPAEIRINQLREAVKAGHHVTLYPAAAAQLLAEIDALTGAVQPGEANGN